jgi:hypothetical protein
METVQTYTNDQLRVDVARENETVVVRFHGKSMLRDPNDFLMPILLRVLGEANAERKRLQLDFRSLAYMNSSTMTPVIKVLEQARVGDGMVTVLYRKALKWQDISFSALVIFQTPDGRIEIQGAE